MASKYIEHETFDEIYQDFRGKDLKFKVTIIDLGTRFCAAANEVTDSPASRSFNGYDYDRGLAILKMRKLVREELNKRYFAGDYDDPFYEMNFDYFRGHLAETPEGETCLNVDGRLMTLDDFGELLSSHSGFRIEVRFLE